jgi:hypothetical protein
MGCDPAKVATIKNAQTPEMGGTTQEKNNF